MKRTTRNSLHLNERSSRIDGFAIASFVAALITLASFPILIYVPSVARLPFPGGPRNSNDANVRIFLALGVFGPILALFFGLIGRARIGGSEGKLRGPRASSRRHCAWVGMGRLSSRRIRGLGLPSGTPNLVTRILVARSVLLRGRRHIPRVWAREFD